MARITNGSILSGVTGKIGNVTVRRRNGKKHAYITPDMSHVKPTASQKEKRNRFKEAVAYAQAILRDPEQKAEYKKKVRRGKSVYHTAIVEYLQSLGCAE